MAKAWSTFHDWILPQVPGAAATLVNRALCDAVIEFYERSGILVTQLSGIPVVPGTASYTLTPPSGYDVARIEELFYGEQRLLPVTLPELAQMYTNWTTIEGPPRFYLQEASTSFRLVPAPDAAGSYPDQLVPRVVLVPTRAATQISEDWVYEDYGEDLAAGAIGRLMQMPQKPWTDLARAAGYAEVFRRAWAKAKNWADRGKAGAVLSVRLRRHI